MFNLFKKIFWGEKKETKKQKLISISFDNVLNFVEKQIVEKQTNAKKKAEELIDVVYYGDLEFKNKTQELKEAKPKIEVFIHKNFDLKIKNEYCDRILAAINKIEKQKIEINEPIDFLNNCESVFRIAGGLGPKNNYMISYFFKEYLKEFVDASTKTQDAMAKLSKFIKEEGKIIYTNNDISNTLKHIKKIENNLFEEQKMHIALLKEIKDLEKKATTLKIDLSNIENNKWFFESKKLKDEIQKLSREKTKIHQQLSTVFDKAHKMIKKYWHLYKDADKTFVKKLEDSLDSLTDTFLHEKNDDKYLLKDILSKVDTTIKNKSFDYDEKEQNQWVLFMASFNIDLETEHKRQYLEIVDKIEKKEAQLKMKTEEYLNKKQSISKEIRSIADELSGLEKQKKNIGENVRALELKLKQDKEILNNKVSKAVDKDVNILYK